MATFRDLATAAGREIGVFAAGEAMPYDDANDALLAMNRLIDQWAAERLEIPNIVRSTITITPNVRDYYLGPAGSTIRDGFESTPAWTGHPPNWTAVVTGTGQVAPNLGVFNDGAMSLDTLGGAAGTATIYRDFEIDSGDRITISVYSWTSTSSAATMRVQNLTSLNYYVGSKNVWQDIADELFTVPNTGGQWGANSISFTTEGAPLIGADTCQLRVIFRNTTNGDVYFDTFAFSQSRPRPESIDHVNLVDTSLSPELETPLSPHTDDSWAAVAQKDQTATRPSRWYYNPTYPSGTLTLWPVPTGSSLRAALYVPTQVAQFSTLDDVVSLPPGYERMIVKNLALEIAPSYGKKPDPALVQQAIDSKAAVKRANRRLSDLSFDGGALIGNTGRWYDIRSGP